MTLINPGQLPLSRDANEIDGDLGPHAFDRGDVRATGAVEAPLAEGPPLLTLSTQGMLVRS